MEMTENIVPEGTGLHIVQGGTGPETVVFLHGNVPGLTPYCGGAYLWRHVLPAFARDRRVIAVDLPGCGASPLDPSAFDIAGMRRRIGETLNALAAGPCHLVGHDQGGLIALTMALEVPETVRSVTVVASPSAAPTGDGLPRLSLAQTPKPLWSLASQAFVLERLSYSRHHLGDLPELAVACAEGEPHRTAVECVRSGGHRDGYGPSAAKAKTQVFAAARETGFPTPVQVVWGSHDPMTRLEEGYVLFKILGAHQSQCQFHVVNRAGSLLFHEEPEAFHRIVSAFQDGVCLEGTAYGEAEAVA